MRYLHEYSPGDTIALGTTSLPQDEIDAFNHRYDPQPQFVDDSLAGPLHGGRIASPGRRPRWRSRCSCVSV